MGFLEAVKSVFSQYATFSGRARRSEYWFFCLFNFLMGFILGIIPIPYISIIYTLIAFLPGLAVAVRRLHDAGKSGWWYFIVLIPIIGWIWILVLYCTDSKPDNEYGPNPKAIA